MSERSNAEWVHDLSQPGQERAAALDDLRALLVRGLGYALAKYGNVTEADVEDFAQDALLKILDALHTFRGESRFTTWANKIAVHVAFTELRRRRWRDVSLDQMIETPDGDLIPRTWEDPSADTEQRALQTQVLEIMRDVIANELTDRQRQALVAARIHGVPLAELADRMGTNRNALYKLLFDARQRLQARLLARGLSTEDILAAFSS
ncbi:MAG: sigma-70 family RNA polymerase sigma factor [Anaerolineae bacterium]|nr:sigma-70 family RNA polymerase sigma factor [Anaerolineae bacterium]